MLFEYCQLWRVKYVIEFEKFFFCIVFNYDAWPLSQEHWSPSEFYSRGIGAGCLFQSYQMYLNITF